MSHTVFFLVIVLKFGGGVCPSLVRLRLGLLGLTALEPKMEEAILIFLLGCGALLLLLLARIED
jgi:hypothetical protein